MDTRLSTLLSPFARLARMASLEREVGSLTANTGSRRRGGAADDDWREKWPYETIDGERSNTTAIVPTRAWLENLKRV